MSKIYIGVTFMVAVTTVVPLLIAVNDGILSLPFAARPIDILLFVQKKSTVFGPDEEGLLKFMAVVLLLLHNDWLATGFTVAIGATIIVNTSGIPKQLTPPFIKVGVTVIVAVNGNRVVFVAIKDGMLPVPEAAKPIDGVLFVQL